MITDICNLNCNYCFANSFVNGDSVNHISVETFTHILDFVEKSKTKEHLGLIGGEPTLHPKFADLLKIVNARETIEDVVVFTNGLKINEFYPELQNPKMHLLINCNSPYIIGEKNYERIVSNIRNAIDLYHMKERITIGVNLFSYDFDYDYIIRLIDVFGFDHLRLSITVPNTDVEIDPLLHYSRMKKVVLRLIEDTLKHNAMPYFDCNKIPVCVLTDEERNRLIKLCGDKQISNIISEYSNCSPVIDIMQDETCVRCFGLSDYLRVDINGFNTIDDLRGFFESQFDDYSYSVYYDGKCKQCYERVCKKCAGGCLKYKIKLIEEKQN